MQPCWLRDPALPPARIFRSKFLLFISSSLRGICYSSLKRLKQFFTNEKADAEDLDTGLLTEVPWSCLQSKQGTEAGGLRS